MLLNYEKDLDNADEIDLDNVVEKLVCAQTVPSPPWWKDYSLRPIVTNAVQ